MKKYISIPYSWTDLEGNKRLVTFFLPISFVETGDLEDCRLSPDNFLGVNLKMLLSTIDKDKLELPE